MENKRLFFEHKTSILFIALKYFAKSILHNFYFQLDSLKYILELLELFKRGSRGAARAAKSLRWSV